MIEDKISDLMKQVHPSGIGQFFDIASRVEGIISLAVGEPDFDTPWHIREAAIHAINEGTTFYAPGPGFIRLREAIANYLYRSYNLKYNPVDEILVTLGCSEAIDLLMRAIINPGDEVIITNPGYVAYEPCVKMFGGVVVNVELKEEEQFKLTAEALAKVITPKTKCLILNFPGNPTGGIMSKEDLEPVVKIIKESGILVLSDEIYGELTYGEKHYSIAQFDEIKDQVIYMNGVSKAYSMTGWRIGYVCGCKTIIDVMKVGHEFMTLSTPTISQYAAIEALNQGDKDIQVHRESFLKRRNYVVNECRRIGLPCHMPQGAFYVFPNIKEYGLSSQEFATRCALEAKVAVVPGTAFGSAGEGFIRISYAYSLDEIKESILRIENWLKSLKEGK